MRALLFSILQIILSILLVAAILLQQRGTGLGAALAAQPKYFAPSAD